MTLTEFVSVLAQYTPIGYSLWAGGSRTAYNNEKTVGDTMLVVLPNPYPAEWRPACSHEVRFSIWFGKVVPIKSTTMNTQEHKPYSSLEIRDELFGVANTYLTALNGSDAMQVLTAPK